VRSVDLLKQKGEKGGEGSGEMSRTAETAEAILSETNSSYTGRGDQAAYPKERREGGGDTAQESLHNGASQGR